MKSFTLQSLLASLRLLQTKLLVFGKKRFLTYGSDLHVGAGTRIWAPKIVSLGSHVYIGKQVHIEANCEIGDYCLIANRVAIVGKNDHDYAAVGFPIRYAPWIGSKRFPSPHIDGKAVIEPDVWVGYGAIVLTGVTIGRGSIVAAGSVVINDIPPYSIAAGIPAKVVNKRFPDEQTIVLHEAAIRNGRFAFSERGYDHCVVEPAATPADRP